MERFCAEFELGAPDRLSLKLHQAATAKLRTDPGLFERVRARIDSWTGASARCMSHPGPIKPLARTAFSHRFGQKQPLLRGRCLASRALLRRLRVPAVGRDAIRA